MVFVVVVLLCCCCVVFSFCKYLPAQLMRMYRRKNLNNLNVIEILKGTIFPLGIDVTDATWAGPNQGMSILLEGTQMECKIE